MNLQLLKGHIPDIVLDQLSRTCEKFNIDGPKRLSHLLGQCKHESNNYSVVVENLNYSADGLMKIFKKYFPTKQIADQYARQPEKIANRVYANRMSNGDEKSGDGWKYRGRGYLQTTGKINYIALGSSLGIDLITSPEKVATTYPLDSAAFFFNSNNLWIICDQGCDDDTITKVTKRVNGGTNGLEERIKYTKEFYNILTESK